MSKPQAEQPTVIVCGTLGWGIGSYTYDNDEGEEEFGYGFPWHGLSPHKFHPDRECCSEQEIQNWEKAKAEFTNPQEQEIRSEG